MTKAQITLYWREWSAVKRRVGDEADDELRHGLHVKALGKDVSSRAFTNAQFDKVLGEFRSLSRPADLDAQLAQLNQPRKRQLWKIGYQKRLLKVFISDPQAYVQTILDERFRGRRLDELSDQRDGFHGRSELDMLIMTLARNIDRMRRDAGLTVREMESLASPARARHQKPQPANV